MPVFMRILSGKEADTLFSVTFSQYLDFLRFLKSMEQMGQHHKLVECEDTFSIFIICSVAPLKMGTHILL